MSIIHNNKGVGLIEVIVAIMLTSIAVIATMSMQPQAWNAAGKTDRLGRAAGVLQDELERNEVAIMNPSVAVTTGGPTSVPIYISGEETSQTGDVPYTVTTTIASAGTNIWRVTIRVTWPGNATGVSSSILVTRQEAFRS